MYSIGFDHYSNNTYDNDIQNDDDDDIHDDDDDVNKNINVKRLNHINPTTLRLEKDNNSSSSSKLKFLLEELEVDVDCNNHHIDRIDDSDDHHIDRIDDSDDRIDDSDDHHIDDNNNAKIDYNYDKNDEYRFNKDQHYDTSDIYNNDRNKDVVNNYDKKIFIIKTMKNLRRNIRTEDVQATDDYGYYNNSDNDNNDDEDDYDDDVELINKEVTVVKSINGSNNIIYQPDSNVYDDGNICSNSLNNKNLDVNCNSDDDDDDDNNDDDDDSIIVASQLNHGVADEAIVTLVDIKLSDGVVGTIAVTRGSKPMVSVIRLCICMCVYPCMYIDMYACMYV